MSTNTSEGPIKDKLQILLASISIILLFGLLPVFQFIYSNPHFYFEYSMDHTLYFLIIIGFGVIPIVCLSSILIFFIKPSKEGLYTKLILGLSLLLFLSQLYTISLVYKPPLLKGIILFPGLAFGIIVIFKFPRVLIWSWAWLLILILPTTIYHAYQQYFFIPKTQITTHQNPIEISKNKNNIYMIFLDGCEITSSYLDDKKLPKIEILPNFRKFLINDAHWFPNSLSNAPSTYLSYPTLITGKLYSSKYNNYLIHKKNIFSILGSSYKINTYISRHTPTTFCLANPGSCNSSAALAYFKPIKYLIEMWINMATFKRYGLYFKSKNYFNDSYSRSMSINSLMKKIESDPEKGNFYLIQLFDREKSQIKEFDKFFGDFINALKKAEKFEESIIVIMSDHGFNRDPSINYGMLAKQTWPLYKVPFGIKPAGTGNGKIYNYKAQNIDVAPTLLARVLPSKQFNDLQFDGVDLLINRPIRKHYINFDKKGVLYRLLDKKAGQPELTEIPLSQISDLMN